MRRDRHRNKLIAEMNVIPYIDVMLVLLIIFMISAPLLHQGIEVDLPKAATKAIENTEEPIIVSVNKKGDMFLNINDDPTAQIQPKDIMMKVAAALHIAKKQNKSISVFVKGDGKVEYDWVVQAMALLQKAGASKIGLMTDSSYFKDKA